MSKEKLDQLRTSISTLTEAERAELAYELVASLDGPRDKDVEQAWDDEIVRRIDQVEAGDAELLSRDEFRKRMKDRLGRS
jgi:putative addiction module component (TIGR02574 family)